MASEIALPAMRALAAAPGGLTAREIVQQAALPQTLAEVRVTQELTRKEARGLVRHETEITAYRNSTRFRWHITAEGREWLEAEPARRAGQGRRRQARVTAAAVRAARKADRARALYAARNAWDDDGDRTAQMRALREQGFTLRQIGLVAGCTGEWVRRIIDGYDEQRKGRNDG